MIYISIFKISIILWSWNKVDQYLGLIVVTLNPNTIKNVKLWYFVSGFAVKYILVLFSPVLKVHFDKFLKKFAFKLLINIYLKYIGSDLAIVFVTNDNF